MLLSSIAKSKPPTGAPNAEDIPAAAPADIKFLLSSGLRNLHKYSFKLIKKLLLGPLKEWKLKSKGLTLKL